MNSLHNWNSHWAAIETILVPVKQGTATVLPAYYTQKLVTIVGLRTTVGRFLPVSHEGESNETYVDKVDLLGKTRAEFIARKQKATERRAHMRLFRQLAESSTNKTWQAAFTDWFRQACEIPNGLCTRCWNDSLFGSLEAGRGATFARARYFDTYSIEDAEQCIARTGSDEGMAVGNTVGEDLSKGRGEASLHYYEYVKAGTNFPFITVIENPTLLDVAGLLHAITLADLHGHGKYSANNGKFSSEIWAVSTGIPRFSVLNMLDWASQDGIDGLRNRFVGQTVNAATNQISREHAGEQRLFEHPINEVLTLWGKDTEALRTSLQEEFGKYQAQLSK